VIAHVNASSRGFLRVSSVIAIGTLLIACMGVGNLIISEITARRYEYGVLRAIGARRWLLARLIVGQTLVVSLVGTILGTALGLHLALTAREFHQRLIGLTYHPRWPWDVAPWGALIVVVAALLAALPAVVRLVRASPRVLLAAGRGG